ncbi:chloramphenicol phosphotransferase [Nocardia sp. NPDC051832]|uniref:chloramphenicol phosphotransferase CPT family protein n=1 Tax=Nocardia sp. NPDC051832 TaxID=3155673 RepID=UPI00341DCCC2
MRNDMSGRVIFLNGTSSSGKTTLARAIQDASESPVLRWGIDGLFAMVPPKWGGGLDGPLSRDGFWYDRSQRDVGGEPLVVVRYGAVGLRMLRSAAAAVGAFARGGNDVVVDEMLLSPELMPVWMSALSGLDVSVVAVTCPLEIAERREVARGNERGVARGHARTVHRHEVRYDLTVDTSVATPAELAETVLRRVWAASS